MRSIRHQLLIWLLAIVVAGVGAAGWLIYRQALAEANELFDYQLQAIAAALPSEPFSQVFGSRTNGDEGIVIQIWNRNGGLMYFSHPRAPIAPRAELGFSTERTDRGEWRVYGAIVGDNVVQLAQPLSVRNRLAASVALRTVWPLILLLPFLGAAVWMIVGRGMRPLRRVTRAVESRRPEALDPLPDNRLPQEVQPLVHALNGLLARLAAALDTQKAFVADAAHELRTPLAAVQIQAQLVARAQDDETRREALADVALRYNVPIVEDDAYAMLPQGAPPPLALLAPELTYYVTGMSKNFGAGLRIAYLLAPSARQAQRIAGALRATTVMPSPYTMLLATQWVNDGTALAMLEAIRAEGGARMAIAAQVLRDWRFDAHPNGFHLWLPIPADCHRFAPELAQQLRNRGVAAVAGAAFSTDGNPPNAIRLCLGGPQTPEDCREALRLVADALGDPHHLATPTI
ncbi:aminotransferase class I/II-fold pyridoxal phosphate-dependent enzyme [Burkholderia sp. Ap-962]|uniref:aminotransferase class I/II-fold pyridoxal phosphate-dependent enzyme n=2 Tax=unclassified Burkholderia TaxID=2613784 RepID=UPI0014239AB5